VAGFLSAPLIGIFTANFLFFVLWAWLAHGIEVLSPAGLLQMYVYLLPVGIAALVVARRLGLWGLFCVGAISLSIKQVAGGRHACRDFRSLAR
jgi:hypothetical protein